MFCSPAIAATEYYTPCGSELQPLCPPEGSQHGQQLLTQAKAPDARQIICHFPRQYLLHIRLVHILRLVQQLRLVLVVDAGLGGHSCRQQEGGHHLRGVAGHVLGHLRPCPHKGHGATQHVQQLADLVQTAAADDLAHPCDAAVAADRHLTADAVSVLHHGAELENAEFTPVLGHPHLPVKHRAAGVQLDGNGQHQKHRAQQHQQHQRCQNIEQPLAKQAPLLLSQQVIVRADLLRPHLLRQILPLPQHHRRYSFTTSANCSVT